jgi:serine/threonine-protein kinase SRK2
MGVCAGVGKGGTGDTWAFVDKRTNEQVAIKFLRRPLPKVLLENIKREFLIQAELGFGHENVIRAYEAVLTPTHLCLVMEYAKGGSLTAHVADKWKQAQANGLFLSEDEARFFFKQFLSAVNYCHQHRVVHRDLKLDNTLLDDSSPPVIKICDFGFAKTWSEEANMYTQIGTPVYMSPELMNQATKEKGYDGRSVDVWAAGILLLVMLLGSFPFDHTEHPDPNTSEAHLEVWLQQVSKRWSDVPHMAEAVKKLSPEIKDLLNRIFVIDAGKRVTIQQIKRHPWYNKPLPPGYQEKWDELKTKQEKLDKWYKEHPLGDNALVTAMNEEIERMVEQSTKVYDPEDEGERGGGDGDAYWMIDLRDKQVCILLVFFSCSSRVSLSARALTHPWRAPNHLPVSVVPFVNGPTLSFFVQVLTCHRVNACGPG